MSLRRLVAIPLCVLAAGAALRQLVLATRRQGWRGLVGRANGGMVVHLGVILIANLEQGYQHPPLRMSVRRAYVRFKKHVLEVKSATLPMLGILAVGVLLITYVPWLTEGLLRMMGRM